VKKVRNHPRKKQPMRFINKVPRGNPLSVCIHSPIAYLDIAPKKPPSITEINFNPFSLLSHEYNAYFEKFYPDYSPARFQFI
jgi:hypothetical protein